MPSHCAEGKMHRAFAFAVVAALLLVAARPAMAIPAFARKYGTSCQTCHVVFPKLNPFGEAFRRNGYRFPGVDSDYVKQPTVPLGQDAYKQLFPNAVWPGTLPTSVPIAIGFNGQALFHPDTSAGAAENGTSFDLSNLIAEAHIWAGGSFSDDMTFFGELTFSDTVEIESAVVFLEDLVGPKHAVNLKVGKTNATLSSFGPHSTYVGDLGIAGLGVTGLFGALSDSWNIVDNFARVDLFGVIGGRFEYDLGLDAGANTDVRNSENVYGHVGYKIGGMSLDAEGEGATAGLNAAKPWAEKALTLDAFAYRSRSHFTASDNATIVDDTAFAIGGGVRAQYDALELDAGIYAEHHDHALLDGTAVDAISQYDELSYVVFPWFVPAVRVEFSHLAPDGGPAVSDLRITPGVAMLIRPNLKLILSAQFEHAQGAPDAGWGNVGGFAAPPTPDVSVTEVETVAATIWFVY
jgi:hypothetical protein